MDKKSFHVLNWDFNTDSLEEYDVLPYFRNCYKNLTKSKRPSTVEEWKEFVKNKGMYEFWSRCQYEIIVTGWPQQKNEAKVDVWRQINMNLDVIVKILMEEFDKKKKDK